MSASILPILTKVADAINARRLSLDEAESRYTEAIAEAENDFETALGYLGLSRHVVEALEIEAQKMSATETPMDAPVAVPVPLAPVKPMVSLRNKLTQEQLAQRHSAQARLRCVYERWKTVATPAQIAQAANVRAKKIPDLIAGEASLQSLEAMIALLESWEQSPPFPTAKQERRQERDEALSRTRGLYEQARNRFSVDQIASRAGIKKGRLNNVLSPTTFCALGAVQALGDSLEAMLAEPVAEKPLSCSACNQPSTESTCHSCITAKAAQAKRESAVKQEAEPKPRIGHDPGRIVAVKPAPTTPTPTPKTFEFTHWMDFAVREIEAGKRQYPHGFSLIRHCIGGDIDANVWECVPVDQRLTAQQALYLRFVFVGGSLSPEKPSVIAIPHRDAAHELYRAMGGV